jgi:hypothetical protein
MAMQAKELREFYQRMRSRIQERMSDFVAKRTATIFGHRRALPQPQTAASRAATIANMLDLRAKQNH